MDVQWALVFFTLFTGLGVGLFVAVVATEWWGKAETVRFPAAVTALVALAIGGVASLLHLGHPDRIFGALGHPTSGIFIEMLFIGLAGIGIIVYLVMLKRGSSDVSRKAVATVTAVPAVVLSFTVGNTYVMASRPAWDTLILPLAYVATAAVMGCAALTLFAAVKEDAESTGRVARALQISLAVQLVLVIAYVASLTWAPFPDTSRSASRVLTGSLAPLFWAGLVLLGLAVPAVVAYLLRAKKEGGLSPRTGAAIGLASVLAGGIAFRALMFALGSGVDNFFSNL
jgi:anaerobic dimethyl sulfoxide reductase subunit C (anchor subunit)